jgi:hypothetical protein
MLLYFLLLTLGQRASASMLYNGAQKTLFSSDLSDACDSAFNTSIDCAANIIQYVTYPIQAVGQYIPIGVFYVRLINNSMLQIGTPHGWTAYVPPSASLPWLIYPLWWTPIATAF